MRSRPLALAAAVVGASLVAATSSAAAAPAVRSTAWAASTSTALTLTSPSGVAAGDVLVASLSTRLAPAGRITAPAGWLRIRRDVSSGGASLTQELYVRVVAPGDPRSHTWTLSASSVSEGTVTAISGADRSAPIEQVAGRLSADSKRLVAPSVTLQTPGSLVLTVFSNNGTRAITQPTGAVEHFDRSASKDSLSVSAEVSSSRRSAAGASGDFVASVPASTSSNIGQVAVIRSAGASEGPPAPQPPAPQAAPEPPTPQPAPQPPAAQPPPAPPTADPGLSAMLPPPLAASRGTAYYVSPLGSDGASGSAGSPWRTIQKALNTLRPGETAFVRTGTYTESLVASRSGTAADPITVRNMPGERPTVRARTGATNNYALYVPGASYVRVQGFVMEGATGPSSANVYFAGAAHHIEVSDCEVRNSQRQGFFFAPESRSVQVLRCSVHDNGSVDNLDHGLYIEGRDHLVADSVISSHADGYGIQVYPTAENVMVVGNTIVDNEKGGIIIGGEGALTADGTMVVNNVIAYNKYGVRSYWSGSVGTGNVAMNNIGFGNASGDFGGTQGAGITFRDNVVANPGFMDRAQDDLRLTTASPAVGGARNGYVSPLDRVGLTRPQGGAPDLGAFER